MTIERRPGAPAGIYIHIPFCSRLCPYCDFAVAVRREIPHESYVDALLAELQTRIDTGELAGRSFGSVYLGGGTPSLLAESATARLLDRVREVAGEAVEWTIEANPNNVTEDLVSFWSDVGISRVSMGVQSFDDAYLARLGRRHSGKVAFDAAGLLAESALDTSVDLIFAGPEHTMAIWKRDVEHLVELGVDHVSAYHLTVEPNTVFARRHERGELELPDDELAVAMLEELRDRLGEFGLTQYEVSSYARRGKRSVHNSNYWLGGEYVGLGVGAHGLRIDAGGVVRTANDRRLRTYMDDPAGVRTEEVVEPPVHLAERLFTGLRTAWGIDVVELRDQFGEEVDPAVWQVVDEVLETVVGHGWALVEAGRIVPTADGYLFADSAAALVFDSLSG